MTDATHESLLASRKARFWERTDYDRAFRGSFGHYMTTIEANALDRVFGDSPVPVLLDLGCGHGRFLRHFAPRAEKMVGLDRSRRLLQVAQEGLDVDPIDTPTDLIWGSATEIPMADGSIDAITCVRVIQHIPDQDLAYREAQRVLAEGGRLILVQYNYVSPHGLIRAIKIPIKAALRAAMRAVGREPKFDEPTGWTSWSGLKRQLQDAGFSVERATGAWLFPLQYFRSRGSNNAWPIFKGLAYLYERLANTRPFCYINNYLIVHCKPNRDSSASS